MAFSDYVLYAPNVLEDFNRATIGTVNWIGGFSTNAAQMQTYTSTEAGRTGAGFGSAVWKDPLPQDCIILWEVSAAGGDMAWDFRAQEILGSTYDSIELNYTSATTTFDLWVITNNTAGASLATTSAVTLAAGDIIGIAGIGSQVITGYKRSGTWNDLITCTDPSPRAGYFGWWANGTTPRVTNMWAGPITPSAATAWWKG